MAANTSIAITDLDFDSIKNNLKDFLKSQTRFQDYDFEGSGMNVLLDILALNTHYNAYYLNMIGNEMFLDTSKIRQSTVSHAKLINYIPESSHGAEAKVNITVTPSISEDQDTNILTLDKYTRFIGSAIDGINYPFVALNSNTVSKSGNSFLFSNVIIKQGEVVTRQFIMSPSNDKRRFDIPTSNVDTNTLVVTVQESNSNTMTTAYIQAQDLTEITANSNVYFIQENEKSEYSIYFGDNVIGKRPKDGNIINITYVDTLGSLGNKISRFTLTETIGGLYNDNVSVTATGSSYSGSEKETIEQVKYRAPYAYTTQNRAVTINDYETLITKDYTNIDSVAVWGGEDNNPPVYGKVYLSLKTKENYFLTNLEKENIKNSLIENRNVLTVIPEIVDPSYVYVLIRGTVYYNPALTSLDSGQIKSYVFAAIEDYGNDNLDRFKDVFQKAKLQQYIENSQDSIIGSDIKTYLQKRFDVTLNQTKNYTIDFGVPIKKGDYANYISTYPAVTVLDKNGVQRAVFFEEVPSIDSGINKIEIVDGGINYSTAPTLTITGDGTGATAIARVAGGRIYEIVITNKGTNYSRAFVTLSSSEGSGAQIKPILESRTGTLRSYYINSNGEKVIVNNNAGTVDYDRGTVVLLSLYPTAVTTNEFYDTNILTVSVPTEKEIISTIRNNIITIDVNDPLAIQLEVIAQQ